VTTTDGTAEPIVWVAGAEGDDRLHAFRGDTGAELWTSPEELTGLRHFVTILAAEGRVYIAGDGRVYAFITAAK
jgi:outer membrane protein assembly factor BamB